MSKLEVKSGNGIRGLFDRITTCFNPLRSEPGILRRISLITLWWGINAFSMVRTRKFLNERINMIIRVLVCDKLILALVLKIRLVIKTHIANGARAKIIMNTYGYLLKGWYCFCKFFASNVSYCCRRLNNGRQTRSTPNTNTLTAWKSLDMRCVSQEL